MHKRKKTAKNFALTLVLIYIAFTSLFSLDVFSEHYSFFETLTALFMHLVPSFILAGTTFLAWKRAKYGGIVFLVLALAFAVFFKAYEDLVVFLVVIGPLLVIGSLFVFADK